MNLPNKLTVSRFYMTGLMMAALSINFHYSSVVALLLFIFASLTDALDGHLARSKYGTTDFGKLMDPLADKVLTSAAFIAFVQIGIIPAWFAVVIITREFMVTGLRLLVAERGVVMSAGIWGKLKTIFQMIAITFAFVILACCDFRVAACSYAIISMNFLMWSAMILTVISGVDYFWKYRAEFMEGA